MELFLFAILPFSLLWWPKERRGIVGIIPLIAALVPAAISGVRALVNRRQAGNAATRAATQAQRADLSRQKQEFYDPAAMQRRESTRTNATMQLGRLAGHFGGLDRVPAALRNALQSRRQEQTFEPNTTAIPNAPDPSGGRLGVAQDIMTGLESFDTNAYNRARNPAPRVPTPPRRF